MKQTYWNNNGKYQKFYENEYSLLVPASGAASTQEGEMLRAATRLLYDYYNNGMLNNTSGAVLYLKQFELGVNNQIDTVYEKCNLGSYTNVELEQPIEDIANAVIAYIISKKGNYTAHTDDLFNYQEPDCVYEYE